MPTRRDIFTDNAIYHVFNKTIDHRSVFSSHAYAHEFKHRVWFYRSNAAVMRYTFYKGLPAPLRESLESKINDIHTHSVEVVAYCLMPNHFHFLIKQKPGGSVERAMSNVLNAFTRYFNTKEKRLGPLFLPRFKSRMIVSDEQFIHTTRYIHLNPYSAGMVHSFDELEGYAHSSYSAYVNGGKDSIIDKTTLDRYMSGNWHRYRRFVENNAEHQRMLEYIKHAEEWR